MAWTSISLISLQTSWQFTEPVEGSIFRLHHEMAPTGGTFVIAQVQVNVDNSIEIADARFYSSSDLPEVIVLEKPQYFTSRRIGVKKISPAPGVEAELRQLLRPTLFNRLANQPFYPGQGSQWKLIIEVNSIALLSLVSQDFLSTQLSPIVTKLNAVNPALVALQQQNVSLGEKLDTLSTLVNNLSAADNANVSPLTSPKTIFGSDLVGWYRADTVVANNNKVSQWTDLSGLNNHATQTTVSNQPTLVSAGFNGKPVIRFDNLDVWFTLPDVLQPAWGQASLFIVYNLKDNTQNWDATRTGSNTGCYWGTVSQFNYAGFFGEFRANRLEFQPASMTVAGQHFVEVISGSGNNAYKVFRNTTNLLTTNPDWGVTTTPYIGRASDAKRMNGDIAEIFIVKRAATDAERQASQQYVKSFWALNTW